MLFRNENIPNPYPAYENLRDKGPVSFDTDLNAWLVTNRELVVQILKDNRFSSDRVTSARAKVHDESLQPVFDTLSLLMLQRDMPDHDRLRHLVHYAFQRTTVDNYANRITEIKEKTKGSKK